MVDFHYPYRVRTLRLRRQIDLAYIDEGHGPFTLLFVHGLGSYLKGWQRNIDSLRRDFRCVAVDLPGYGRSGRGDYPFGMRFFAGCLIELIDRLELQRVVAVGHSMGGQISLWLTLLERSLLERLALLAPAGFETFTLPEKQWLRSLYNPALMRAMPVDQIRQNLEMNFFRFPADAQFMFDDRLRLQERPADFDAYCRMIPRCVESMLDEPVYDRLPEVKLPTLVLFGNEDRLIPNKLLHPQLTPRSVAEHGIRKMQRATLHLLPECGHFLQWECAFEVNEAIRRFLTD